jgi:RNA polymerase sigma-70 factor (ECF subfamily)
VDATPQKPTPGNFALTRWTLVLRARGGSPEARAALAELCEAYYQPVFRFLCREGRSDDAAQELTQEFFTRILAGRALDAIQRERGRFRSYLLGAVKHFLADVHDHEHRLKRGGGAAPDSLDAPTSTETATGIQVADPAATPADQVFDRQWALAVIDHALKALEGELAAAGKREQFNLLQPWLVGDAAGGSQADTARHLGLSEGALKVVVHRLRKRFRDLVRAEIAQTVGDPATVQDELRYLVEVLSHPPTR